MGKMHIVNRTMSGLMALATAISTFGRSSPEVAELGGLTHTRTWWRRSLKVPAMRTAAQHKRAAKTRQNVRARASKR